jgi:hypothetical protein
MGRKEGRGLKDRFEEGWRGEREPATATLVRWESLYVFGYLEASEG